MSISRRHFMQLGAVTAISAGASLGLTASASDKSPASVVDQIAKARAREESKLNYAAFAACLNSRFTLVTEDSARLSVELVEVADQLKSSKRTGAHRGVKENFSLAFKAPRDASLAQNTYQLEHAKLGKFNLFIGPVESGKHGQIYEAVINRI
jgi:Domain of unknown function (DUF6916)